MKFISWNLKNIAISKTQTTRGSYRFQPIFSQFGLGNNLLDYVSRVVTGDPVWKNLQSEAPADAFVIIELKCGYGQRGYPAFGSGPIVLSRFSAAMNQLVANRGLGGQYHYDFVPPLIVGRHESVGIIYNTLALNPVHSEVLRNTMNDAHFGNFSPFLSLFETHHPKVEPYVAITGLHALPGNPKQDRGKASPINYCQQLGNTEANMHENSFIMGDFNCNPSSYYIGRDGNPRHPFDTLPEFKTPMYDGRFLSTFHSKLSGSYPFKPANYLANAYDNILRNVSLSRARVIVMDLLKNARDHSRPSQPDAMRNHGDAVFNANVKISDHLPVMIEF